MKKLFTILAILLTCNVYAQSLAIQSDVVVIYHVPGTINQNDTAMIRGKIKGVYMSNDCEAISVDYSYTKLDGTNIDTNVKIVTGAEIQATYDLIKNDIPANLSYSQTRMYEFYWAFKYTMAETFKIAPSSIQIVVE